jgi:hypothetical protein
MRDMCLGPIDPATNLPDETCGEAATKMLFFPHESGVAFMFSCDRHLESLGRWAGIRFGGCFAGGPIAKGARAMTDAAAKFGRIDIPHGEEFNALVGVPGAPKRFRGGRGVRISRN